MNQIQKKNPPNPHPVKYQTLNASLVPWPKVSRSAATTTTPPTTTCTATAYSTTYSSTRSRPPSPPGPWCWRPAPAAAQSCPTSSSTSRRPWSRMCATTALIGGHAFCRGMLLTRQVSLCPPLSMDKLWRPSTSIWTTGIEMFTDKRFFMFLWGSEL